MNIVHVRYLAPILQKSITEIQNVVDRLKRLGLESNDIYFDPFIHLHFLYPDDKEFTKAVNAARSQTILTKTPFSPYADKLINTTISIANTLRDELQIPKERILGYANTEKIEVQLAKAANLAKIADEVTNLPVQEEETENCHRN